MRIRVFKIESKVKDYFMLLNFKLKDFPVAIVDKNGDLFLLDLKRKFKQETIYLYNDAYNTRPEILRLGKLIGTFEYKPNKAELESYPILDPKMVDINVHSNSQVYPYFSDHISFYSPSGINKCTRHFLSKILDKLK